MADCSGSVISLTSLFTRVFDTAEDYRAFAPVSGLLAGASSGHMATASVGGQSSAAKSSKAATTPNGAEQKGSSAAIHRKVKPTRQSSAQGSG